MGHTKESNISTVTWALLVEGVSAARLEAHRLRNQVARVLALVEQSEAREALYEAAGDLIMATPKRIEELERHLDRTSYALSVLGEEDLRDRLPLSDRKVVDEANEKPKTMTARVADRYLSKRRADLSPPLGYPGGPCHVIDRIRQEVHNPQLREDLIDDIEHDGNLEGAEAHRVYQDEETERGTGRFKTFKLTSHAQFRMDQRGVSVPLIRRAMDTFLKAWSDAKSRRSPVWERWEQDMSYGEKITWTDPKLRLVVVFRVQRDSAVIITTYWDGVSTPGAVGEGACDG